VEVVGEVVAVEAGAVMMMDLVTAAEIWKKDLVVCHLAVPQLQQTTMKNGTKIGTVNEPHEHTVINFLQIPFVAQHLYYIYIPSLTVHLHNFYKN